MYAKLFHLALLSVSVILASPVPGYEPQTTTTVRPITKKPCLESPYPGYPSLGNSLWPSYDKKRDKAEVALYVAVPILWPFGRCGCGGKGGHKHWLGCCTADTPQVPTTEKPPPHKPHGYYRWVPASTEQPEVEIITVETPEENEPPPKLRGPHGHYGHPGPHGPRKHRRRHGYKGRSSGEK